MTPAREGRGLPAPRRDRAPGAVRFCHWCLGWRHWRLARLPVGVLAMSAVILPRRSRGRQTATAQALYGDRDPRVLRRNSRNQLKTGFQGQQPRLVLPPRGARARERRFRHRAEADQRLSQERRLCRSTSAPRTASASSINLGGLDATTPDREAEGDRRQVRWLPRRYTPVSASGTIRIITCKCWSRRSTCVRCSLATAPAITCRSLIPAAGPTSTAVPP